MTTGKLHSLLDVREIGTGPVMPGQHIAARIDCSRLPSVATTPFPHQDAFPEHFWQDVGRMQAG
jgi:hypothetical protein